MTSIDLQSHMTQCIEKSEALQEPFFHLCLSNCFPEKFYSGMHAHFPSREHFKELRHPHALLDDGTSSRLEIVFSERTLSKLTADQQDIWRAVYDGLSSKSFEQALIKSHHSALNKRFGPELSTLELTPRIALVQDLTGYRIGIHRDIPSKVITTQFYLPTDDTHEHVGTSFYSKSDNGKYEFIKKSPFKPNLGYSFTVTNDSFHGVLDPLAEEDSPRNSVMIIYYVKNGNKSKY